MLPHDQEGKPDIVVEVSPIIRAQFFAKYTGSLTNFGEFAVLVYYEVMKHASNYDRIDLVFDRYSRKVSRKRQGLGRGDGLQYLFEGDSTEISYKMAESFLKTNQNKNKLNKYLPLKLLEFHQGDQIMTATYKNTSQQITSSPSSCAELKTQVSVRPCKAEEAHQRLVRQTLNLINNGYTNILVCTIDTDVLILLISYIRQVELNDIEVRAYLIKLGQVLQHQIDHTRTWF